MNEKTKKIVSAVSIVLALAFIGLVGWFIGKPMLELVSDPEAFRLWVDSNGIWGRILFVGMMMAQVLIALIPGEPLEIGAGYAFGVVEGTLWCMAGIVLGSLCIFLLVRRFGVKLVEVFFSVEKIRSLKFLQDSKKLNTVAFVVFFLPGTPKDLLSYFVGLTDMKLSTWMLIATVARIPSVITSTVGGSALGEQNYVTAIIVFAVTGILSIAGALIYKKISGRRQKNQ